MADDADRVWTDVQDYKWPIVQQGAPGAPNFNVIQAQDDNQNWIPKWIIVDGDGTCLCTFELEEPITPEDVAKAAYDIIRDMHGIGVGTTGEEGIIVPIDVGPEDPPEF